MAAAAGAVNGVGFLVCQQYVSHVTGTVTRAGLEYRDFGLVAAYVVVFGGFLAGATASVVAIQGRVVLGQRPKWANPLIAVSLILVGTAFAGNAGAFDQFGATASDPPPVVLLTLLSFAMGLQNAAVAVTTGLAVRTTHLTGPTTDLGVHLGTALLATGAERKAALSGAALRGGKILTFMLGAGLSLPLAEMYGYLALLAPAGMVLIAAGMSFVPEWSPIDFPEKPGKAPAGMAVTSTEPTSGLAGQRGQVPQ